MNGHQGSWGATGLRLPRILLGSHAIGPISEVAVDVQGGRPTVRVRGKRLEIYSHTDQSSNVRRDEVASGPLLWNDIALLSQAELRGVSHGFDAGLPVPALTKDILVTFTEGTALIDRNMGEYRGWVQRLIRQILVLKAEDSFRMESGSGEQAPGLIHISYPLSPPEVAEILIHEASHQYFYLLEKLGPLDDGSDPQGYWSPPIRRHRPLSRILMAYHAFANVRLFYERCRSRGEISSYLALHERNMLIDVEKLDEPLRCNSALTSLGKAIYEPLACRLAEINADRSEFKVQSR
jgi:HEXXH motif-containing protein